MPRFLDSCGCYNREVAREVGVIAAIVFNDIQDKYDYYKRENELVNGMFYLSQTNRADALAIPRKSYGQALTILQEKGFINKKISYKPGTQTKATWVSVLTDAFSLGENDQSERAKTTNLYNNDTNKTILKDDELMVNETTKEENEPKVVYLKVNPSGRAWKSKRVYTTASEVERLEDMSDDDYIDFKHWMSPNMVGNDDRAKIRHMKVKLVQPDVEEEKENTVVHGGKEVKIDRQIYGKVY